MLHRQDGFSLFAGLNRCQHLQRVGSQRGKVGLDDRVIRKLIDFEKAAGLLLTAHERVDLNDKGPSAYLERLILFSMNGHRDSFGLALAGV